MSEPFNFSVTEDNPDKLLYDYTRALASGMALSDGFLKTVLPNLYLENKKVYSTTPLVYSGDYPDRYSQAYSEALTRIGTSFGVERGAGEADESYRQKIKLVIIQNPTLSGIENAVKTLFSGLGLTVNVNVFTGHTDFFDAVNSNFDTPFRGNFGARAFKVIIEIYPSIERRVPRFVDDIFANIPYRVKVPGNYKLTLDPSRAFGPFQNVSITKTDTQNPEFETQTILSDSISRSGRTIDLGFLTNFHSVSITTRSSLRNIYYGSLEFDDTSFDFYRNPSYNGLLSSFGVSLLRDIFSNILANGVEIERIVVRKAGSGG